MTNTEKLRKLENIEDAISDMISLRCSIQRNLAELNLDGDTTAWYSHIGEAIERGAYFKLDVKVTRSSQIGDTEYDGIEIEW